MKMPVRRYFPTKLPPDMFGLELLTMMSDACLSDDERNARRGTIKDHVAKAFKAACRQLGEDDARALFREVTRKRKRGVMTALAADRDYQLLRAYDTRAPGETVKALSERLYDEGRGTKLGQSADAIRRQIFAVVKQRRQRDRERAIQNRYMRMATRNEPPTAMTILGRADSAK